MPGQAAAAAGARVDAFSQRTECRVTGVYGMLDQKDRTTTRNGGPGTDTNTRTRPPGYEETESRGELRTMVTSFPKRVEGRVPTCGISSLNIDA